MAKISGKKVILGVGALVILIVIGGKVILAKQQDSEKYVGSKGKVVEVITAQKGTLSESLSVLGKMTDTDKRTLYLQTSDEVLTLPKRIGDEVKAGEVVATFKGEGSETLLHQIEQINKQIDNATLTLNETADIDVQAQILKLEAELGVCQQSDQELNLSIIAQQDKIALAKKELEELKTKVETEASLYEQGASSEKEYNESKLALESKELEITSMEDNIKNAELQRQTLAQKMTSLSYDLGELRGKASDASYQRSVATDTNNVAILKDKKVALEEELAKVCLELKAPVDGQIASINVAEGQSVTSDMPIMTIVQNKNMLIQIELSSEEVSYVQIGQKCTFQYWGKDEVTGEGIVKRIAPSVVSETKSNGTVKKYIPVEIEITQLTHPLMDGLEVDVEIITLQEENGIVLPKSAILMDEDEKNYVYVVNENGAAKKMPIYIKTATKTEAMVEGVNEEQKIIMSNLEEIQDGTKVRYLR